MCIDQPNCSLLILVRGRIQMLSMKLCVQILRHLNLRQKTAKQKFASKLCHATLTTSYSLEIVYDCDDIHVQCHLSKTCWTTNLLLILYRNIEILGTISTNTTPNFFYRFFRSMNYLTAKIVINVTLRKCLERPTWNKRIIIL